MNDFVEKYVRGKTKPEPEDRKLGPQDYVALMGLAREAAETYLQRQVARDPREKRALDTLEESKIIDTLIAPLEWSIYGVSSLQIRLDGQNLGSALPAENFKELKTRLATGYDGMVEIVGNAARATPMGKFSPEDRDKLHQAYKEIAADMERMVDAYKEETKATPGIGRAQ